MANGILDEENEIIDRIISELRKNGFLHEAKSQLSENDFEVLDLFLISANIIANYTEILTYLPPAFKVFKKVKVSKYLLPYKQAILDDMEILYSQLNPVNPVMPGESTISRVGSVLDRIPTIVFEILISALLTFIVAEVYMFFIFSDSEMSKVGDKIIFSVFLLLIFVFFQGRVVPAFRSKK